MRECSQTNARSVLRTLTSLFHITECFSIPKGRAELLRITIYTQSFGAKERSYVRFSAKGEMEQKQE